MSLQETMLAAMSRLVSANINQQVTVTHFSDTMPTGGGCDTCGYGAGEYSVDMYYTDGMGRGRVYEYTDGLSQLIFDLDRL